MCEQDEKSIILQVWSERYTPAAPGEANAMKTSADILLDLRPMAEFTTNEIAKYLQSEGYRPYFQGDTPMWLLIDTTQK